MLFMHSVKSLYCTYNKFIFNIDYEIYLLLDENFKYHIYFCTLKIILEKKERKNTLQYDIEIKFVSITEND